jgi:hypothetical protein
MASFTGKNICNTFNSILNIGTTDQQCLPSTGQCIITDSIGECSALSLGRVSNGIAVTGNANIGGCIISTAACITGNVTVDGNTILGNDNNVDSTVSCGDFFVGGSTGSGNRCVSIDAATGNTAIKGTLNVGADELDTTINLFVNGVATVTGEIRSCADIVAYSTSDCNLKSNLNKICNTQSIINGLSGYSFDWNDKSDKEGSDLGLMAQDVQKVLPSIVKERDNGYLAVDYIKLIPVLIEEVKRLSAEVEELKSIQTF